MPSLAAGRSSQLRAILTVLLPVLVGLCLHAPSLTWGFYADDFGQQLVLDEAFRHESLRPWNLYDFGTPPAKGTQAYETGSLPWWTSGDWRIAFLRPVASLSLMLDHAVFGRVAAAYHATNLLLFAVALVLAFGLYQAAGIERRASLAALWILATNGVALLPVGWLANRNALLEAVFTLLALLLLARERDAPRPLALALALAACALACLSKESGIAAPLACALFLGLRGMRDPRGKPRGVRRTELCFVLLGAIYVIAYVGSGHGSRALFYPAPWADPVAWVENLAILVAPGLLGILLPIPVDVLTLHRAELFARPLLAFALFALSAGLLFVLTRWIWRTARRAPLAGFFAAFAALALAPQAGSPPSERLYFVPLFGIAPLLGTFLVDALAKEARGGGRALRWTGWAIAVLLFLVQGPWLLARGITFRSMIADSNAVLREAEIGPGTGTRREVVILQAPSAIPALAPMAQYRFDGGDPRTRVWVLQMGRRGLAWRRVAERRHVFESRDEPFLGLLFERVFLTGSPFPRVWSTAAFRIADVTPPQRSGLQVIELELERAAGETVFVVWRDGKLRRIAPPAVGEEIEIERAEPLSRWMP